MNASTEWYITNTIGIIKASLRHRLTHRLSLHVQGLAVSGPINFENFFSHFYIPQFYKYSYAAALRYKCVPNCSVCVCIVQSKQKNGCKCEKRSLTNTRNYCITLAVCAFKITCNALARINFEFTFELMTVALLKTKAFKILFQEQGIFRTSRSIFISHSSWNFHVRFFVKLHIPTVSSSTHVEERDCFVIIVYNVRREMLLPVPKHLH